MSKVLTFQELIESGQLELGDGYRTKKSEHGKPGLPILRVAEVLDGRISPQFGDYVSGEYRRAMGAKTSRPGDIVLTTKGTVGRVAIMPDDGTEFVYSPQVCYFRVPARGLVTPKYLYYWFRSVEFWSQARQVKGQTDMADYVNLSDIRALKISLPSPGEQEVITGVLGALDDKIAVNDRIASAGLDLAVARYSQLAEIEGWGTRQLRDTSQWLSGGTPKTSEPTYWGGGIPWISALSLRSPWIFESTRNVTALGAQNGTRLVPSETILFVVRGSSLDTEFRVGITQREVAFGQDCKALRTRDEVDTTTLFVALRANSKKILKLVDHAGHGAGRLSTDLIGSFEVQLPSGQRVVSVADQLKPLVDLGAAKQVENRELVTLRDTLLPKLMSGEIRVRDAEKAVEDAV